MRADQMYLLFLLVKIAITKAFLEGTKLHALACGLKLCQPYPALSREKIRMPFAPRSVLLFRTGKNLSEAAKKVQTAYVPGIRQRPPLSGSEPATRRGFLGSELPGNQACEG